MLLAFKRWLSGGTDPEWGEVSGWAKQQGWDFKRVSEVGGFVIDGALDGASGQLPWRMEWGPSQRDYIPGKELRMRIELQLPHDLQMLVISQALMEQLEKAAYEHFTQTSQTFIDGSAPEEMRWLSMFSKASVADKNLRSRFGALASEPVLASSWLDGPMGGLLLQASEQWLPAQPPMVLMTLRGRLYLRLGIVDLQVPVLDGVVRLFCAAAFHAHRVAQTSGMLSANEWPSTAISAWQAQLDAGDSCIDSQTGPPTR